MSIKRIKKLARWLPLLSLLATVGAGLLALRLQAPLATHLRNAVMWEVSRSVKGTVRLGESRLALLPMQEAADGTALPARLRLSLRDLVIGGTRASAGDEQVEGVLRVPDLNIDLSLKRLLEERNLASSLYQIQALRPHLLLERDAEGRWNIADLLIEKPAEPTWLAAKVMVAEGRLTLVDFSPPPGLPAPQENHLEEINCSVFARRAPVDSAPPAASPLKIQFKLSGNSREQRTGRFALFGAYSSVDKSPGKPALNRLSATLNLPGADLKYLWDYGAVSASIEARQGTGTIRGFFAMQQTPPLPRRLDYIVTLAGEEMALSLPWVRGEVQDISGRVRASNGVVQLTELEARLASSRVRGEGFLVTAKSAAPAEATKPPASTPVGLAYALRFVSEEASAPALAAALPESIAAQIARQPLSGSVSVSIVGENSAPAVYGRLALPRLALPRDLVALPPQVEASLPAEVTHAGGEFVYARSAVGLAASAGLLEGTARAALFLPAKGAGRFAGSLDKVRLPEVSLARANRLRGTVWANLQGEVPRARPGGKVSPSISGDIALAQGELHTQIKDKGEVRLTIDRAAADFAYRGGALALSQGRIDTDLGNLDLGGNISAAGEIDAFVEAKNLHLKALGEVFDQDIDGRAFLSAKINGTPSHPRFALRGDIFSGHVQGFQYDWLGGNLIYLDGALPEFDFVFSRGSGEGRLQGEMVLPSGADAGRIDAVATISKAQLAQWLPANLQRWAQGMLDSQIVVRGTPASPVVEADFQVIRPLFAGVQFDAAGGRARYADHAFNLTEFNALVNGSLFSAAGSYDAAGRLDFHFAADRMKLAALLGSRPAFGADGWLSLQGTLQGARASPRLEAQLRAQELTIADSPAGQIIADVAWEGQKASLRDMEFSARGGKINLSGDIFRPQNAALPGAQGWQADLNADIAGMEIGFMLDLLERGARASAVADGRLLAALEKVPRPLRGFLTASADLSGPLLAPTCRAEFAVSDASLLGQRLPSLEGAVGLTKDKLVVDSFIAREGDAFASAFGELEFAGVTELNVDIHNLSAKVLQPWIQGLSNLGGSADSYLMITGPTRRPTIRGDLEVADPILGGVALERLKIDRFLLTQDSLEIENLRVVKGPHLARLSAVLPFSLGDSKLEANAPFWVEASLQEQNLAFISALWPQLGQLEGPLDARLRVAGTTASPQLESGHLRAAGQWARDGARAQVSLDCQVRDHIFQIGESEKWPGLHIVAQRQRDGKIRNIGEMLAYGYWSPFAGPPDRWGPGRYEVKLLADNLQASLAGIARGRLSADLTLLGRPEAKQQDLMRGQVLVSDADVTVPEGKSKKEFSWRPRFSPHLDLSVELRKVQVSTTMVKVELQGSGVVGGRLGYEPLALNMRLQSDRGRLNFPAAAADIKELEITVTKEPDAPLYALATVVAEARVSRYRITLSGGGQLFPSGEELRISAQSTPPLTEEQATALLLGVPPTALGGAQASAALGQQFSQSFSSSVTSIAAAGLSAPLLRATGLNELSFAITPVSSTFTFGKRLAKEIYLYYLSTISGESGSNLLGLIFDITRDISVGVAVNEQEQTQYELQTTRAF